MRLLYLLPMILLQAACLALPIPHDRPLSPAISGTVRDKITWQALPGATVRVIATELADGETATATTDARGNYHVQVTKRHNWMFFFFAPAHGTCGSEVTISAPGYEPVSRDYFKFDSGSGKGACAGVREYLNVELEAEAR